MSIFLQSKSIGLYFDISLYFYNVIFRIYSYQFYYKRFSSSTQFLLWSVSFWFSKVDSKSFSNWGFYENRFLHLSEAPNFLTYKPRSPIVSTLTFLLCYQPTVVKFLKLLNTLARDEFCEEFLSFKVSIIFQFASLYEIVKSLPEILGKDETIYPKDPLREVVGFYFCVSYTLFMNFSQVSLLVLGFVFPFILSSQHSSAYIIFIYKFIVN